MASLASDIVTYLTNKYYMDKCSKVVEHLFEYHYEYYELWSATKLRKYVA